MELKKHKSMENLEKLESIIGKFPAQNWEFYANKLGWSKSKTYEYFNSLQIRERVYSKNGFWYPKTPNKVEIQKESFLSKVKKLLSSEIALTPEINFSKEQIAMMETIAQEYDYAWLKKFVKNVKEENLNFNKEV